jgi:hypothetical protein
MPDLFLYLLERDADIVDYGKTESAVVVASDINDARDVMFHNDGDKYVWYHPREVTVTYLGTSNDGERGVVLASIRPN